MLWKVIINNYQKGAKLKSTPVDKIIYTDQIGPNQYEVIYDLDSKREQEFIEKVFNKKMINFENEVSEFEKEYSKQDKDYIDSELGKEFDYDYFDAGEFYSDPEEYDPMYYYRESYEIGDEITYDSNIRGIKPNIGKGVIVDKDRTFATRGMSAEDTYKVKKPNGDIITVDKLMIIEDEPITENIIKENVNLKDYKKAGYAFKVRTTYSGYVDLFCYSDKRTCKKYYDAFIDTIEQFNNSEEDSLALQDAYEDNIQGVYEAAQRYTSDFYEEIDWRKNIIDYKGTEVYVDNFNDRYYIILNSNTIDI